MRYDTKTTIISEPVEVKKNAPIEYDYLTPFPNEYTVPYFQPVTLKYRNRNVDAWGMLQ